MSDKIGNQTSSEQLGSDRGVMGNSPIPARGADLTTQVLPPELAGVPILIGQDSPGIRQRVEHFANDVAAMFETWANRSGNANTRRTYRRAVLNFIDFVGIDWPRDSYQLLHVTVPQVESWRDFMAGDPDDPDDGQAPGTVNGRISALSHFYNYLRETATTELRLPVQVPNPAHPQFIKRNAGAPKRPTLALTRNLARELIGLPAKDLATTSDEPKPVTTPVLAAQARAWLSTFIYVGVRIRTMTLFKVSDFHDDSSDPTLLLQEKGHGKEKRRVGINPIAAEAIRTHLETAEISRGFIFRPRLNSRSKKLGNNRINERTLFRAAEGYLRRLPNAVDAEGRCRYSPHSFRATTATLLDEDGVPIKKIMELLGHKDIRVTQQYIKMVRDTMQSASHAVRL